MPFSRLFAFGAFALTLSCGGQSPPAASPAPAPPPVVSASAAKSSSPAPYTGHGASTVPPELIAKYAAAPLSPDVSHRIQSMLEVRAPSAGIPSDDGRSLFLTWNVTGIV